MGEGRERRKQVGRGEGVEGGSWRGEVESISALTEYHALLLILKYNNSIQNLMIGTKKK